MKSLFKTVNMQHLECCVWERHTGLWLDGIWVQLGPNRENGGIPFRDSCVGVPCVHTLSYRAQQPSWLLYTQSTPVCSLQKQVLNFSSIVWVEHHEMDVSTQCHNLLPLVHNNHGGLILFLCSIVACFIFLFLNLVDSPMDSSRSLWGTVPVFIHFRNYPSH